MNDAPSEKITKTEFEAQYVAKSGRSLEYFAELGMHVYPCDCGETICQGWKMDGDELQDDG